MFFFFSSRRRHTRWPRDWSSDVCSSDLMPNMNGVQATANLVRNYPRTRVIILSIHDDESYVTHALKTGAQGYLLKEMDSDALIDAIKVVSEGGSYLHPKITHNLVLEYRQLAKANIKNVGDTIEYRKPLHLLTKRE